MLALEQGGESLHQIMNSLERKYENVAKKVKRSERFWNMFREYENRLGCELSLAS